MTTTVYSAQPTEIQRGAPTEAGAEDYEVIDDLRRLIQQAVAFNDQGVGDALTAQDYYDGLPFGNEEPGRSQIVLTDVADTVDALLSQLLDVIFGHDTPLEFVGHNAAQQEAAKQATRYVRSFFEDKNAGFLRCFDLLKDALIKRRGVLKVSLDETVRWESVTWTGLNDEAIQMLAQDPSIMNATVTPEGVGVQDPTGALMQTYSVQALVRSTTPTVRVEAVPREEFLVVEDARSPDDALYVGHRRDLTVGELVGMGYDRDVIEEYASASAQLAMSPEAQQRQPGGLGPVRSGAANRLVEYIESYAMLELVPDGGDTPIYARWKICTIGQARLVLHRELCDDVPFVCFTPYPVPHSMEGKSVYDRVGSLQLAKSVATRSTLDSLSLSLFGRKAYNENKVSAGDVMNTANGAPIRVDGSPAENIMNIGHDFIGQYALPFIQMFDQLKEARTGVGAGVGTMDVDALQSTEKNAAKATIAMTQAQIKMVARILVEMALKPLFQKILKVLIEHPDAAVPIYKGGTWIEGDPRSWAPTWDLSVNVGVGSSTQEKIAALGMTAEKQEQAIQLGGPDNPITDVTKLRATYAEMQRLAGIHDANTFWKTPEEIQQHMQAMAQQPPEPSPEMLLAQNEIKKADQGFTIKQAELELESATKEREAQQAMQEATQKAALDSQKLENDLTIAREKIAADIVIAREKIAADMQLEQLKIGAKLEDSAADREATAQTSERETSAPKQPSVSVALPDSIAGTVADVIAQAIAPIAQTMAQAMAEMSKVSAQLAQVAATVSQPVIMPSPPPPAPEPRKPRSFVATRPDGTKLHIQET